MCNLDKLKDNSECWIKVFTSIAFGFLIFNVIWYWFISDEHNASGIILSFYVLFFAAIIFMCRVLKKPKRLLETFVFMKTKIGPGVFIIFCGCISMDEEWIHVRNLWSIIVIVMGSLVLTLDCKYTEEEAIANYVDNSQSDNSQGPGPGGKPIALSDMGHGSFGGGGAKNQGPNQNEKVNVDYPSNTSSQQGPGGPPQMFVSDQKYKLDFNNNNPHGNVGGDQGGDGQGGLGPSIY
jgi:hypothetical protein